MLVNKVLFTFMHDGKLLGISVEFTSEQKTMQANLCLLNVIVAGNF